MAARTIKKAQEIAVPTELSIAQESVILALLEGKSQKEAAESAGVGAEQVSRWKANDALFVAELNRQRAELWEVNRAELLTLAKDARQVVREVLTSESESVRLRAALAVLDRVGQYPTGATSAREVAQEWKEAENSIALSEMFSFPL